MDQKQIQAKYAQYLALSDQERSEKIKNAKQRTIGFVNPQENYIFPEKNFTKFIVEDQQGNEILLANFRHVSKQKPKALVCIFHGLNSHINQGAHLAHKMAKHGFITVGFDHRGFGQSQGQPGYIHSRETHLQDCWKFVEMVKNIYPQLPIFCLGLSLGGMAAYYLTLRNLSFFAGAILMAPALKSGLGCATIGLLRILKKILPQKMKLMKPVYGLAAKNTEITEFVKADPFSFKQRACLSTLHMLIDTMVISSNSFKDYSAPFIIIQGGLDKLVDPIGAFQLFKESKTKEEDKEIQFYQDMWHGIWHEEQIHEIMNKVIDWMQRQLSKQQKNTKQKNLPK